MEVTASTLSEKIRVLTITANSELLSGLLTTLGQVNGIEVIEHVPHEDNYLGAIENLDFDVLLAEANHPLVSGFAISEHLSLVRPEVATILLSEADSVDVMRTAVQAGAMDLLALPASLEELAFSISRAHQVASHRFRNRVFPRECRVSETSIRQTGMTITVCGGKGGAGKSTVAAILARYFCERTSISVALVDFDLQFGDIGVLFDAKTERSILNLLPLVDELDNEVLKSVAYHVEGELDLFLAPLELQRLDPLTTKEITGLVDGLKKAYDIVIINTAPQVSELHLDLFESSDIALVVVNQDIPSLRACAQLKSIYEGLALDCDRLSVVLNKFSPDHHITIKRIEDHLGLNVIGSIKSLNSSQLDAFLREGFSLSGASQQVNAVDSFAHAVGKKLGIEDTLETGDGRRMRWRRFFKR